MKDLSKHSKKMKKNTDEYDDVKYSVRAKYIEDNKIKQYIYHADNLTDAILKQWQLESDTKYFDIKLKRL